MIKLRNILQEFDYGRRLFADPDNYDNVRDADELGPVGYGNIWDIETDTEDETHAMELLSTFYQGDFVGLDERKLKILIKSLKRLKTKFPKILDPRTSAEVEKYVYRGATISMDAIKDMSFKLISNDIVFMVPDGFKVHPRSGRPIHSFSVEKYMAEQYVHGKVYDSILDPGRIPIVIHVDANNPNLLFSTNFSSLHSTYGDEKEVFYAADNIIVSRLSVKQDVIRQIYENDKAIDRMSDMQDVYTKLYNAIA